MLRPSIRAMVLMVVLDVLCVGMGMGVPIFCIALGFPAGWVIAVRVARRMAAIHEVFRNVLFLSVLSVLPTFVMMLAIWGPMFLKLFDPAVDVGRVGIPLWLFEAKASFIGWHVLMIVISPFLQLLTTIFAAYLALCRVTAQRQSGAEEPTEAP